MSESMGYGATVKINRWGEHRLGLIVLAATAIAGTIASGDAYLIRLLTLGCIYGALALGLRMTFGELGELDLGYLALYAGGGYAYGLVRIHWGLSELPAALVAIAMVAVVSLLISLLTLRLTGPFFAVGTLGLLIVATSLIATTTDLTGGINGLKGFGGGAGTPVPYTDWSSGRAWFLFAFAVLAFVAGCTYWLQRSRFGDAINAIRQDPVLFRSLGYDVTMFRAFAAGLGGAIAGLAGSVFAMYSGFVSIDLLSLTLLGSVLLILKVGGARSAAGVVIGAFVVTLVPEYLRFVGEHRLLVFGVVLVISVRVFQSGIGPELGELIGKLRRRTHRTPPPPEDATPTKLLAGSETPR